MIQATLVYLIRDDKVLMLHRNKKEGDLHLHKYNGLGGKIEEGELPIQAAEREFKEESGALVKGLTLAGFLKFPRFDREGRDWLVWVYQAHDFLGKLEEDGPEGTLLWVPVDEVLKLPLWEGDREFLPHVFNQKYFEGIFYYHHGQLEDFRLHCSP